GGDGSLGGSDESAEERALPEWKPAEQLPGQLFARLGLGRLASGRIGSASGESSADQVPGEIRPLLEGGRGQEQLLVAAAPELVEKGLPYDSPLSLQTRGQLCVAPGLQQPEEVRARGDPGAERMQQLEGLGALELEPAQEPRHARGIVGGKPACGGGLEEGGKDHRREVRQSGIAPV